LHAGHTSEIHSETHHDDDDDDDGDDNEDLALSLVFNLGTISRSRRAATETKLLGATLSLRQTLTRADNGIIQ